MKLKIKKCVGLFVFGATMSAQGELVGHWRFDEGEGAVATDSSAAGNDGAITGATWGEGDAVFANYLVFDGEDQNVDPSVALPVMTLTNDFTWTVWVNSQDGADVPAQSDAIIIGNRVTTSGEDSVPRQFIKLTPTKFEWHQNDNGNDNLDVDDLEVEEWHHLAVVKTGANLEYFFDGASIATQALMEEPGAEENPFLIGGQTRNAQTARREFFNGFIAEVRIYDEALSAEAVQAVFLENAPPAAGPAELVITSITRAANNDIELTWRSNPLLTYALDVSTGLTEVGEIGGWQETVDSISASGDSTSFILPASLLPSLNTEPKLFFRIREEAPVPVE